MRGTTSPGRAFPAWLLGVWALGLTIIGGAAIASSALDRDIAFFTRDPVSAVRLDGCENAACSYAGIVSSAGVVAWIAGATIALLCAAAAPVPPRERRMFLWAGALSALLGLDDLLLLHESYFGQVVPKGEAGVFLLYGLCAVGFAVAFRRDLMRLRLAWLLPVAGALFAAAILVDWRAADQHLAEDGLKLMAVLTWTAFLAVTASAAIRGDVGRSV